MSDLVLILPDSALRDALTEQLRAGTFGTFELADSLTTTFKNEKTIVIDTDNIALPAAVKKGQMPSLIGLGREENKDPRLSAFFLKPFRLGALLDRLRYEINTAPRIRGLSFRLGPWLFEESGRHLQGEDGTLVHLTEKETALLAFLGRHDAPQSREAVLASVWGYGNGIDTHTLETHLYQLRRKLGQSPQGGDFLFIENGHIRLLMKAPAAT